jgi:hypothetical protein
MQIRALCAGTRWGGIGQWGGTPAARTLVVGRRVHMRDGRAWPGLATALGVGACGMAVAVSRGPSMDGHHAAFYVPCDE